MRSQRRNAGSHSFSPPIGPSPAEVPVPAGCSPPVAYYISSSCSSADRLLRSRRPPQRERAPAGVRSLLDLGPGRVRRGRCGYFGADSGIYAPVFSGWSASSPLARLVLLHRLRVATARPRGFALERGCPRAARDVGQACGGPPNSINVCMAAEADDELGEMGCAVRMPLRWPRR
jgi:hypothetical protein